MVLWTRLAKPGPAPRGALSHVRIAEAGIAIADAEGLENVSMRKVAARLECGTMSLYRYVDSRDDLIDLMADRVTEDLVAADRTGDWRADLTEAARRTRRTATAHPWMAAHVPARNGFGPGMLRLIESSLGLVDGYGLDIDQMLDIWMTVTTFTQGHVLQEIGERDVERLTGTPLDEWRRRQGPWIHQVIATGGFPLVTRVVLDAEDFPDPDVVFERRLGHVLDGIAPLIEGRGP